MQPVELVPCPGSEKADICGRGSLINRSSYPQLPSEDNSKCNLIE
jgi:hypothetical protein